MQCDTERVQCALSYRWREFNTKLNEISINVCIVDGYLMPNKNIHHAHSFACMESYASRYCTVHNRKRKTKCK